jgi:FkbM family methyltransferase
MRIAGRECEARKLTLRDVLRPVVPTGLLELMREWRAFRRVGRSTAHAFLNAARPADRRMRRVARLDALPDWFFGDVGCVVDVGAERGVWSEAILALVRPSSLYAVEPAPGSFVELEERLQPYGGVHLFRCAAGSSTGTASLKLMSDPLWNSTLPVRSEVLTHYPKLEEVGVVEVEVTPLDSLLQDASSIDLLKVDVQGTEAEVFAGATETLARTAIVMLEVNFVSHYRGDTLFVGLHELMTEAGFELYRYADPHHDAGRLLYADAIYVRQRSGHAAAKRWAA